MPENSGDAYQLLVERHSRAINILQSKGYKYITEIGSGSYGRVYKMLEPSNGRQTAVKIVLYEQVKEHEVKVWPKIQHPNLISLSDLFLLEDPRAAAFIMPLQMTALHEAIQDPAFLNKMGAFNTVKIWINQILLAVNYLHNHLACHLDLKTDNILISYSSSALVSDYTFLNCTLKRLQSHDIGVPFKYRPPELLKCTENDTFNGTSVDVWALGMMFVEVLTSFGITKAAPSNIESFADKISVILYNLLKADTFKASLLSLFPMDVIPDRQITEALNFLKEFLKHEESERITAGTALNHRFFWQDTSSNDTNIKIQSPGSDHHNSVKNLPQFSEVVNTVGLRNISLNNIYDTKPITNVEVGANLNDNDHDFVDDYDVSDSDISNDSVTVSNSVSEVAENYGLIEQKGVKKRGLIRWMRKKLSSCRKIFSGRKEKGSK